MKQCFRLVFPERRRVRHWAEVVEVRLELIGDDRRGRVILALVGRHRFRNAGRGGQVVRPRVIEYFLQNGVIEIDRSASKVTRSGC